MDCILNWKLRNLPNMSSSSYFYQIINLKVITFIVKYHNFLLYHRETLWTYIQVRSEDSSRYKRCTIFAKVRTYFSDNLESVRRPAGSYQFRRSFRLPSSSQHSAQFILVRWDVHTDWNFICLESFTLFPVRCFRTDTPSQMVISRRIRFRIRWKTDLFQILHRFCMPLLTCLQLPSTKQNIQNLLTSLTRKLTLLTLTS